MADSKSLMHFSSSQLTLAICASLVFSSCGIKKQVDEMHDATVSMSKTTKEMNTSMGDMKDLTTELRDKTATLSEQTGAVGTTSKNLESETAELYDALRQGDSMTARRNGVEAISKAEDSAKKISEAGKYFMSFEVQLFTMDQKDIPHRREDLAALAAREFMRDVQEFVEPGQVNPSPLAAPKAGFGVESANKQQSLNAIAAALHMVNPKQTEMRARFPDVKEISMYSMIKESLIASQQITAGKKTLEDFPAYVSEILIYESVAKLLMQARYNFFGAMTISRISPIRQGILNFLDMRFTNWTLDLSNVGLIETKESAHYLEGAMKTYDALRTAGIKPRMSPPLLKIYSHMKIPASLQSEVSLVSAANAKNATQAQKVAVTPKMKYNAALLESVNLYVRSATDLKLQLPKYQD